MDNVDEVKRFAYERKIHHFLPDRMVARAKMELFSALGQDILTSGASNFNLVITFEEEPPVYPTKPNRTLRLLATVVFNKKTF